MERRLTAILAADVVGYSRLMGANESGTLAALDQLRSDLVNPKISEHQGRIVKLTGDGMLVEFPSVVNAVACAAEMQRGICKRNAGVPKDHRIEFRIGVNVGDVIVQGEDIFGKHRHPRRNNNLRTSPRSLRQSTRPRFRGHGRADSEEHREASSRLPRLPRYSHCSGHQGQGRNAPRTIGQTGNCSPAFQQHERRPGTGILQ